MTKRSANGAQGILLRLADDSYCFRVYDTNHNFVDYDITHYDLEITINDDSACFVDNGDQHSIDYTDESLGIEHGKN